MLNPRKILTSATLTSFIALSALSAEVSAAPLTFDLNCAKSSNGNTCDTFSPAKSWGTLTISENKTDANWVDIAIDLVPLSMANGQKIQAFYLNFDSKEFVSGYKFQATGDANSVTYDENSQTGGAGPNLGFFDLFAKSGESDPVLVTLKLLDTNDAFVNLDPEFFNELNVLKPNKESIIDGPLYTLVHIGSCGGSFTANGTTYDCSPGNKDGKDSIWVGSTGDIVDEQEIPEPASLLLFGAGLLGLSLSRRFKLA